MTVLDITCMHCIYNYVPETNHVYRVYSVGAVLYLQSVLHVMLRVGGGGNEKQHSYCLCYHIITFIIIIIIIVTRGSHAI